MYSLNLALSILKHNRVFLDDPAFQDIDDTDIVPETKDNSNFI